MRTIWIGALLLTAAAHAGAASSAYAYAQVGFPDRVIGQFTATDSSDQTTATGGVTFATAYGAILDRTSSAHLAPSAGYSRTDFQVQGFDQPVELTFTWAVQGRYLFTANDASWGWDASFGVTTGSPSGGGSYSVFGNQVTQDGNNSIGNPNSIVNCNGNTRDRWYCGTRFNLSTPTRFDVKVQADHDTTGYIEQKTGGDGWSASFFLLTRLVSVTAPAGAMSAASLSDPPRVLFEDGSSMLIGVVPEPGTWAMMLSGLVACGWVARRRASRPINSRAGT